MTQETVAGIEAELYELLGAGLDADEIIKKALPLAFGTANVVADLAAGKKTPATPPPAPPPPAPKGSGFGDFMKSKAGPLPVWGWLATGAVVVGGVLLLRSRGQR
jgi:hypothetical protein